MTGRWGGSMIARLRPAVLACYGATCWRCHRPINLALAWPAHGSFSIDHLVPRHDGGTNDLENLRPVHLSCNASKGARPAGAGRRPETGPAGLLGLVRPPG